jgi:hypothetical protein
MKSTALFLQFFLLWTAQVRIPGPGGGSSGGSGGAPTFALIAQTFKASAGGGNVTTPAMNTTGANLIVVGLTTNSFNTFTDSLSNTWTQMDGYINSGCSSITSWWYAYNPAVGPAQTFSSVGAGYPIVTVIAFSGAHSGTLDQHSTARVGGPALTLQAPSITPTANNELIVSLLGNADNANGGDGSAIDSGLTIVNYSPFNNGNSIGGAIAYSTLATAAPIAPTWTMSDSTSCPVVMLASFK